MSTFWHILANIIIHSLVENLKLPEKKSAVRLKKMMPDTIFVTEQKYEEVISAAMSKKDED